MDFDERFERVRRRVENKLGNAAGCHDFDHTLRVLHNAELLAAELPEADRKIVRLAALLHDFARRIGSDFYILPSSVHEVLLIPADNQISMSTLSSMVRDVNSSQLAREEILSDHVYYYSLETDQITM